MTEFLSKLAVIKEIREKTKASDQLAIPQLIVTGSQSVGKSTVMTACTGVPFPSAAGICTKAPTVVSCSRDENLKKNEFEIEDVNSPGTYKPVAYEDVEREITKAQVALLKKAGKELGDTWIVEDEIRLRARGPELLDIILVDLPGLIENAPEGVTDEELKLLKQQLDNVIRGYAKKPETLIAVVQMANEDIERVYAVRLAKKFDPRGCRTFKILNKFDACESEENEARAVRSVNEAKCSEYGPHALIRRNRDGGMKDPSEELKELGEMGVCEARRGIENLKKRLEKMFANLIDANLPKLKESIDIGLERAEKSLSVIGTQEVPPFSLIREVAQALETGANDLTKKKLTPAVKKFADAVHGERQTVTIDFVSEGYAHDAAKPSELQLEENFNLSLVKVTGLWKPHLETYMEEVRKQLDNWFKEKIKESCGASAKLKSFLFGKFDSLKRDLLQDFQQGCLHALDAELCFGSINDNYFNAKRRQYDMLPQQLEDSLTAAMEDIIRKATHEAAAKAHLGKNGDVFSTWKVTDKIFTGTVKESYISQQEVREKIGEIRKEIKVKEEDMVEHNKQATHTLVMANFDVACKTFPDNVWKRTLEMIRPIPKKVHANKRASSGGQPESVMDWVKYHLMNDDAMMREAVEDDEIRTKRVELKETIQRLQECSAALGKLWDGGRMSKFETGEQVDKEAAVKRAADEEGSSEDEKQEDDHPSKKQKQQTSTSDGTTQE
eukprot:TRINITY_DN18617_c0_g1_i1.p1 TRINITY_DN18617_c0_g1~~TRINITY_DN18617_c0_g1_i1.p1  ORF type:complete len:727 (+),score=122.48 TRINITY_DN18617_c0_g1_i1:157-2337(+)